MIDAIRRAIEGDSRIAYAILFGSAARGTAHAASDVDIGIGGPGTRVLDTLAIGQLTAALETATGRAVHLVLLDEAPPGLVYRVFRDGRPVLVRDASAFKARLARAILEYLDYQPVEQIFTRGVLRARHGR